MIFLEPPLRGAIENRFYKTWLFQPTSGGGLTEDQLFLKFAKTKLTFVMVRNVMKHTIHKWGGDISSIHEVIGPQHTSVPTKK